MKRGTAVGPEPHHDAGETLQRGVVTRVVMARSTLLAAMRRQLDDKQYGQVRSGDTRTVPSGYQDSVADYYRRLSKNK